MCVYTHECVCIYLVLKLNFKKMARSIVGVASPKSVGQAGNSGKNGSCNLESEIYKAGQQAENLGRIFMLSS